MPAPPKPPTPSPLAPDGSVATEARVASGTPKFTDESSDPARVLRRFRVVFNTVRTHFRQMERLVGLGGAQVWALGLIQVHPGIGMGELAQRMQIHQSTASNLVKTLQRKALVETEKSAHDRRSVCLSITSEGRSLLARAPSPIEGVLPKALGQLPAETLARLDHDLSALIALLDADLQSEQTPLSEM